MAQHVAKQPLTKSKRYQKFVQDRDRALEVLHSKAQYQVTDILGGALQRVMEIVSHWYEKSSNSHLLLMQLDQLINQAFAHAHSQMIPVIFRLRRNTYLLSNAGEVEAISRGLDKPLRRLLNKAKIDHVTKREMPSGGSVDDRVKLYLDRIKRKVLDAVQMSAINDEPLGDAKSRVMISFPKVRYLRRVSKELYEPKFKEADRENNDYILGYVPEELRMKPSALSTGFIDDDSWNDMIDEYKSEYIPTWRGPDGELDVQLGEGTPRYAWELEKEMTQDFVQQVRDGENDAALENGITDFVWVAIVDNHTDECCLWRDGLTTQEISLALENEHADDECDTESPPAHFNCRCRLAPATEGMPEQPDSRIGDFTAWLDQTTS